MKTSLISKPSTPFSKSAGHMGHPGAGSVHFGELRLIRNPALPKQLGSAIQPARLAPVAQLDRALPSEAGKRLF